LFIAGSFLKVILVVESAVDEQVVSDLNRRVSLSRTRDRTRAFWLGPGHSFQIEYVQIVEEVLAIPASEDDHLGPADEIGGVSEARRRRAAALRSLGSVSGLTWYHVIETGSSECRSRNTTFFSPLPPKMMSLEPASTEEWPYLAAGGVPEIFGFFRVICGYMPFIIVNV
jgi:hypothetical protein